MELSQCYFTCFVPQLKGIFNSSLGSTFCIVKEITFQLTNRRRGIHFSLRCSQAETLVARRLVKISKCERVKGAVSH